ncbi:MAG TPA: sigma-54 dependent transcriptional regulator, partial [Syntrophobacteraceae bacterium]|nr:sigma-54 dependent transcriptional regulator [Syntrophobacteraceae bacterium]
NGAWDYVQKPASCEAIRLPLVRALQFREQKAVKSHIRKSGKAVRAFKREGIVGDSLKMEACMDLLAQAAGSNANVLITGETGTGKELFACAIHENSSRAGKAFVVVDCAALAESLVESVLFGHEKGAFTGADKAQDGMIKQADGGTLFLDEVGELPPSVQKAFLRVLQEHRFRRLGGKEEDHSDFRLIAATNRDLEQMVREGQFRKDLFFRLRSLSIEAPLLRDRVEDIKDLAIHHMAKQCERYGTCTKGLSPEFLNALTSYDWPGNVRELVHTMESSLIAARSEPILYPDHLPVHVRIQVARTSIARAAPNAAGPREVVEFCCRLPTMQDSREAAVADAERNYLQRLMYLTGTNIKEACKMAGLSRSQLYALLKKHGITRSGRPVESVEESGVSG